MALDGAGEDEMTNHEKIALVLELKREQLASTERQIANELSFIAQQAGRGIENAEEILRRVPGILGRLLSEREIAKAEIAGLTLAAQLSAEV
jgi:hypothetical protein